MLWLTGALSYAESDSAVSDVSTKGQFTPRTNNFITACAYSDRFARLHGHGTAGDRKDHMPDQQCIYSYFYWEL